MTRLLLLVVALELLIGGALVLVRLRRPSPPAPDLALVDVLAGDQLRAQARACRSAKDWRDLGEAYMALGFFPEAEACHRVAANREPGDAGLAHEWAFALERLGRTEEAVREYRRAADLGHPRAAEVRFLAARSLLRQELPEDAHAEFERATNAVPMARYELARLHFRAGRLDEATRLLDPLLAEFPDAIQPATLRHRIAHQQGDGPAAYRYADLADRAARRLDNPFDHDATRLLDAHARLGPGGNWKAAEKLLRADRITDAERAVREGLAVRWHPVGADLLVEAAFQRGRPEEALRLAEEIVARDGPSAHHLARLGDALAEVGRPADARAAWLRSVALGSHVETRDTHYRLAEAFEKAGDLEQHRRHLARAGLGIGIDRLRAGAIDQARDLFAEAVEADPKLATAWFYLGEANRLAGRRADSLRAYRQCLAVDPDHGRALAALEQLAVRK
jgi:tetratricopeptide (TPR) repeat protein